jgi:hypothetical protein
MKIVIGYDSESRNCIHVELSRTGVTTLTNYVILPIDALTRKVSVLIQENSESTTYTASSVDVDTIVRNIRAFFVTTNNELVYRIYDKDKLVSVNNDIPLSFIRANTVVNLGRL